MIGVMSKTTTEQNDGNNNRSYSSKREWPSFQHSVAYLNIVDDIPHRTEGEAGQSTSRLVQNE
jgi:hypothetical protein